MAESETDAEFVERAWLERLGLREVDASRLFALARRGAAVVALPVEDYHRLITSSSRTVSEYRTGATLLDTTCCLHSCS